MELDLIRNREYLNTSTIIKRNTVANSNSKY